MPRGARPKLTPTTQAEVCKQMALGLPVDQAAVLAGVAGATVFMWMAKGRAQKRGIYREFLEAVEKARIECTQRDLATIAKAAVGTDKRPGQWQAAAWRLERRVPADWGARLRVEMQSQIETAGAALEEEFRDEPHLFERALRAIAGSVVSASVESPDDRATREGAQRGDAGGSPIRSVDANPEAG